MTLADAGFYPRPVPPELPVWIAVGGTPASVVRAGRLGVPPCFAILSQPDRIRSLADLYRTTGTGEGEGESVGHDPARLRVGVTSHFCVEPTSQGGRDTSFPCYSRYVGDDKAGARREVLPRDAFGARARPHGALFPGGPQEIRVPAVRRSTSNWA